LPHAILSFPPRPLWRGGGGSVQRIGWIPAVAQCLETHAERIDEHEPADKSFAETGDFVDNFQRPKSRNPKSAAPKKRSVKSNADRMSKISMPTALIAKPNWLENRLLLVNVTTSLTAD
jgi:hypothetical protein